MADEVARGLSAKKRDWLIIIKAEEPALDDQDAHYGTYTSAMERARTLSSRASWQASGHNRRVYVLVKGKSNTTGLFVKVFEAWTKLKDGAPAR